MALFNLLKRTFIVAFLLHAPILQAEQTPADVKVDHDWVRPSHPGQTVGAAYMTLTSQEQQDLIAVSTEVADAVEIHSMTMQDGVMKMRRLSTLPLEANKPVALTPGGFHLMLFDLKKPLAVGDSVTFNLSFKTKDGETKHLKIDSKVKSPADNNEHMHHH